MWPARTSFRSLSQLGAGQRPAGALLRVPSGDRVAPRSGDALDHRALGRVILCAATDPKVGGGFHMRIVTSNVPPHQKGGRSGRDLLILYKLTVVGCAVISVHKARRTSMLKVASGQWTLPS